LLDQLIHNRLNFKWYPNDNWTFTAELRTRLFFGEIVKSTPNYGELVGDANNDFLDLSLLLVDQPSFVAHTMLDRLYFEYINGNWEVRLGRQRINWGINTIWNPNDIFNAFAFTDFDYEERPGSDALRVQYYTGVASSVELAVKAFDEWDEAVAAALLKFNKWNYDFQLMAGVVQGEMVLGGGWAGNLKNAGFKGELSYFQSFDETIDNSFAATLSADYSFKNGLYLSGGMLYNSNGELDRSITDLFSFELSAKNLYPYRYAFFLQGNGALSPLLSTGVALIYSPGSANALFINPNFTYSMSDDWNLDLVGQLVFNQAERYESPIQAIFLRFKFSF
ncbi:MAG: hypothetical protein AAFO94_02230, partial [Bacteroidota bacterium]